MQCSESIRESGGVGGGGGAEDEKVCKKKRKTKNETRNQNQKKKNEKKNDTKHCKNRNKENNKILEKCKLHFLTHTEVKCQEIRERAAAKHAHHNTSGNAMRSVHLDTWSLLLFITTTLLFFQSQDQRTARTSWNVLPAH